MKIIIAGSLDFTDQMKEAADALGKKGHSTTIPHGSELILSKKMTLEEIRSAGGAQKTEGFDVIRYYFKQIQAADALLVLNREKKGIPNYIGANTLMEIAFAYTLGKKIFLMNPLPDMDFHHDELVAMGPIIINNDLSKIE